MRLASIAVALALVLPHGSSAAAWTSDERAVRGGATARTLTRRSLLESPHAENNEEPATPRRRELKDRDRMLKSSKKSGSSSKSNSNKGSKGGPGLFFSEDLLQEFEEDFDEDIYHEFSYEFSYSSKSGKKSGKSTKSSSSSGDYHLYDPKTGDKLSKKSAGSSSSSGSKKSKSGNRLTMAPFSDDMTSVPASDDVSNPPGKNQAIEALLFLYFLP
jgi:hypothetical protein